jgi:hypothetical protein
MSAIGEPDDDRSTRRRLGQKLRMMDRNRSAIRQMDVERLKWTGGMQLPQLLDCHNSNVPRCNGGGYVVASCALCSRRRMPRSQRS